MEAPEGGAAPEGGTATYTPPASQDDLDRIVGQRLAKERSKYADYDELKDKASKFDEAQAASKTEMQTLQEQLAERDQQLSTLPTEIRKQAIRFASIATSKGFLDPEDALLNIGDGVDLADNDAVTTALDEVAQRKPHLVRAAKPATTTRPKPKQGEPNGDQLGDLSGKEKAAAALRALRAGNR